MNRILTCHQHKTFWYSEFEEAEPEDEGEEEEQPVNITEIDSFSPMNLRLCRPAPGRPKKSESWGIYKIILLLKSLKNKNKEK